MSMKKINKVLIIDGNNFCYRGYHKFKNMKSKSGKGTSIIYGVPLMVNTLISNFKPDAIFFVVDGHRSRYRLEILPGYKEGRKKVGYDPEDFHAQKFAVMDFLHKGLGVSVIRDEYQETDDVIYALCKRLKKKAKEIIICSSDKDFNQLISDKVKVWNHSKEVVLDEENLKTHFGYNPKQCVDFLTLIGDDSDKIPGYRGIGEAKAMDFLSKFSSIKSFLKGEETYKGIDKEKLAELHKAAKVLINLKTYYKEFNSDLVIETYDGSEPKIDYQFITNFCIDYSLNTFRMDNFSNKFKELWKKKGFTLLDQVGQVKAH